MPCLTESGCLQPLLRRLQRCRAALACCRQQTFDLRARLPHRRSGRRDRRAGRRLRAAGRTAHLLRCRLAGGQRPPNAIDAVEHQTQGAARRDRDAAAQVAHIVPIVRDDAAVIFREPARLRIGQCGAVGSPFAIHRQEVVHAVRVGGHHRRRQRHVTLQQVPQHVVVITGAVEGLDLLRGGVDAHLPVMRTCGADRVDRHHVVGHAVAAFRNAPVQTGRAIGVERLAPQVEVVGRHLCERAAEGVSGHGHFGHRSARLASLPFRVLDRATGQLHRIRRLAVGAREHHAAVGDHAVTERLPPELGAAMGGDHRATGLMLIDGALVTGARIVHMVDHAVALAADDDILVEQVLHLPATIVAVIRKVGILLRGESHGQASPAVSTMSKNSSRWSAGTFCRSGCP